MTKNSKEHGLVSLIQKQRISSTEDQHKDFPKQSVCMFLSQAEPKKVWTLVDLPYGKRAIGTKWVYKNKKDERGIVIRNKARVPFLYGKIEEEFYEVYVCQPLGFEDPEFPDRVYKMSFMGELTFFLGLQVSQKDDGIFISQDKYVDEILKKFGFSTVKTASTPMETSKPLLKDAEAKDVDVHLYRSMIRSLMYLTASRPDIMFAICACARFQVTPKVSHLHDVKIIFRYLKGQPKLGLWYPKDSPFDLEAYTDSDYAGASLDRKSTTGGCQFLKSRLISWQCKKQTIVANSTTEAKKAKRTTEISQSSGPIPLLANETVIKKWEDRMERAVTTASSLEAEQDNGNINRTQSMATLNESFPQETGSGSGPRCQYTILWGVEAHIRFETASKQSNDPPLSRVNTLRSGEDSMKLKELMDLYTKLPEKVLDLG
ncbi:uncharacterized mitochondrial protein-like protein [Tanacetum coccineum]|uniref:Uncharacterized mitochondrial protein-like protein n=1 Tax=Tanacetum coccineum TaxID=301880 RepID=A0ABQ5AR78_9ASTR